MGLDSVELLMEVEAYFGISIPDDEAEKIYNVQAMVDTVARHLKVTGNSTDLRDTIFERLNLALIKLGLVDSSVALTDKISKYISPVSKDTWEALRRELGLEVPKPDSVTEESKKFMDRMKYAINFTPKYDWSCITIDEFVVAICASNYHSLVNIKDIKSTYDILIAVTGITVDKIGVSYYEVAPGKSFTTDLGID